MERKIIPRGSTPTLTFALKGIQTGDIVAGDITISQLTRPVISKDIMSAEMNSNIVRLTLTQRETLRLRAGKAEAQMHIRLADGTALTSPKQPFDVGELDKEGEV